MKVKLLTAVLAVMLTLPGCQTTVSPDNTPNEKVSTDESTQTAERNDSTVAEPYTRDTKIDDVMSDPVFENYGHLLFPTDDYYYSGETLEELRLVYYNNIDPDMTVKILNTLRDRAADGETIFYNIYTDEEKSADPDKEDTGLFFFKGEPGAKRGRRVRVCRRDAGQLPARVDDF